MRRKNPRFLLICTVVLLAAVVVFSWQNAEKWRSLQLFFASWESCISAGQQTLDRGEYDQSEVFLRRALESSSSEPQALQSSSRIMSLKCLHDLYTVCDQRDKLDAIDAVIEKERASRAAVLINEARQLLRALPVGEKNDSPFFLSTVEGLDDTARQLCDLNKVAAAQALLKQTLTALPSPKSPGLRDLTGLTLVGLAGMSRMSQGDTSAEEYLYQAMHCLPEHPRPDRLTARLALEIARELFETGLSDKATENAKQALALVTAQTPPDTIAEIQLLLARLQLASRETIPQCALSLAKARAASLSSNNKDLIARCDLLEGMLKARNGAITQGEQALSEALSEIELCPESSDLTLAGALRERARLCAQQRQYAQCEPMLRRSAARLDLSPDRTRQLYQVLNDLWQLYLQTKQPERANAVRMRMDMLHYTP